MKIVLIGSGNTATVLGTLLKEKGHAIVQVMSRQSLHASKLAEELGCQYTDRLEDIDREAECYLMAVSDTALVELATELSLPGRLVLHTAGSVSKDVLLPVSEHSGIFYPLQSLRRDLLPYPQIPVLIDAHKEEDLPRILQLARSISHQVEKADDETRMKLHLAAILVNNFSNHLYTLAADLCRKEGLNFSMLLPLIRETAERAGRIAPSQAQTGPAIRGDKETMEKHLELLGNYPDIQAIYRLFSDEISEFYRR
jgi:predicted short-subunit dehydrogenase-like oxidoreductase (DUF2520 family)